MTQQVPITVFLGTKAQLVKMAPILYELDRRHWDYQIIDTGQHAGLISEIQKTFEVRAPDIQLYGDRRPGVSTIWEGCHWMASLASQYLPRARFVKCKLFHGKTGISLVHGDTMSTLLATLIARRGGQKVAHVEAGLRSWRYFDPFPEELVRLCVMRLAHYLFASSAAAQDNLDKMSLLKRTYTLPGNTALDILRRDLQRTPSSIPELPAGYAVATVHRLETIYRRPNLMRVIDILLEAHQQKPLVFVQHAPTLQRLRAYKLDDRLAAAGVIQIPLLDHVSFLHLLRGASMILTDGGSIQEEASYLGVPCLLLRHTVERDEGIGKNVLLSNMNIGTCISFFDQYTAYRRPAMSNSVPSPSAVFVDHLAEIGESLLAETKTLR